MTVLVVEDDPNILRKIEQHIFLAFDYESQVLKAKTFAQAKEIIESGLVEISIIDFTLPDGHSEDLIALIREQPRRHPIIVQTTIKDRDYQIKIYKEYGDIIYLTKDVLFEELTEHLLEARASLKDTATHRLAIPGQKIITSLDINQICYVTTIMGTNNLHVELYDFEEKAYTYTEINNMSLDKFMQEYNELGTFLRCHKSYIVSIKMIEQVSRDDNEILLLYRRKYHGEVKIDIGKVYKKDVLAVLKGLY